MTGAGTAEAPYIVNSWEEYSGIGSYEVLYAEFAPNAENKVIDFNEICPEGFSKTVEFARYTNFNDWTLKNFHSTANKAIKTGIGGKIDNLNFENFCWYPLESTETYLFYDTGSIGLTMTNCTISGQIQALNKINYVIPGALYESSLNIIVNTNNTFYVAKNFINSDIVLDISAKSVSLCYSNIINSRVSGKVQTAETFTTGGTGSAYNVFNVQSDKAIGYSGKGISVYNSDIAPSPETVSDSFVGCTSEQLRDAQYLYNLRFPIGAE